MSITAEVLGIDDFNEQSFADRVDHIRVCAENTLIYQFRDGTIPKCSGKTGPASKAGQLK